MNNFLISLIILIACVGTVSGLECYFCYDCPAPFNPYSSIVQRRLSSTNFCAKKSVSQYSGGPASRGPAEYGLCRSSGCTWRYDGDSGRDMLVCCCRGSLCNTGSLTSKSTIAVLLGALALLAVHRYV